MSVDVFGRKLSGRRANGHRGPPGVGFKLTAEGHFDLQNKRLENLAPPRQPNDAIDWETVQRIVQLEIKSMTDITARLRSELDDLDVIVKAELLQIKTIIQNIQERFDGRRTTESGGGASQASET